jgi:hypothetical protein
MCIGAFAAPFVDPRGSWVLLAVVAALVTYYGFQSNVIYSGFCVLLGVEMLYGFPPAVLSLAYLLVAYACIGMQRFISMVPWSHRDGWALGECLQAIFFAWVFSLSTLVVSVPVGALLYRWGMMGLRVQSLLDPSLAIILLLFSAGVLIAVRRMTIPFRRAILFGS